MATFTDSIIDTLPPHESIYRQHGLRCSVQAKVWMNVHEARTSIGSPLSYGLIEVIFGWALVLFEGQMSSFLQDMVCTSRRFEFYLMYYNLTKCQYYSKKWSTHVEIQLTSKFPILFNKRLHCLGQSERSSQILECYCVIISYLRSRFNTKI